MLNFFKSLFIESSARWLFWILAVEYFLAINIPPNILTDYPLLKSLVNIMDFIPAIHNFDKIAIHPEAVSLYIALTILFVIPKAFAIHDWLKKNPNRELRQYVVSPLTDTQPATSRQIWTDGTMTEEQIGQQPTKPRSMRSRVFWSLMILLFSLGTVVVLLTLGFSTTSAFVLDDYQHISQGGISMWLSLSLKKSTLSALLFAASTFVIKDYVVYFKTRPKVSKDFWWEEPK